VDTIHQWKSTATFSVDFATSTSKSVVQENNAMPRVLTTKQKKIARVAKPRNKITGADFKKLKKKKKTRSA
jgi:hypothetical protein